MPHIELTELAATPWRSAALARLPPRTARAGPWPGVVMIHEAFGLDDVLRHRAERLAAAGYLTLTLDLFSAGGTLRCLVSTMRDMMKGQGRPFADVEVAQLRRSRP